MKAWLFIFVFALGLSPLDSFARSDQSFVFSSTRHQLCPAELGHSDSRTFFSVTFGTHFFLKETPWVETRWFSGSRIEDFWIRIASAAVRTRIRNALIDAFALSSRDASAMLSSSRSRYGATIPLMAILPQVVREYTNIQSDQGNCFNAIEAWFYPNSKIRNMPLHEFNGFVSEHLKPIESQNPDLGDVVLIKDEYGDIMHAAMVITPNFVWHKPTAFSEPWTFETVENMLRPYSEVEGEHLKVEYWQFDR